MGQSVPQVTPFIQSKCRKTNLSCHCFQQLIGSQPRGHGFNSQKLLFYIRVVVTIGKHRLTGNRLKTDIDKWIHYILNRVKIVGLSQQQVMALIGTYSSEDQYYKYFSNSSFLFYSILCNAKMQSQKKNSSFGKKQCSI